MRFTTRQYAYVAAILALGVFNGVRFYRARHGLPLPTATAHLPPGTSPLWSAFDTAAAQREADDAHFHPALDALNQALAAPNAAGVSPQTSKDEFADLQACRTWLLFYRQEVLHPSVNRPGWKEQALQHVLSCAQNHRDDSR